MRIFVILAFIVSLFVMVLIFTGNSAYKAEEFEADTDRPGLDYANFEPAKPLPALCRKACQEDRRCAAWTYVKPDTLQGPNPRCWLKYNIPNPSQNDCCVSGVVRTPIEVDGFCRDYAIKANEQNKTNIDKDCGYQPPRWQSSYANHYNWCVTVDRKAAKYQIMERQRALERCFGGNPREFCENYGSKALSQQGENLALKCGYGLPAWSDDFQYHYDWCMRGLFKEAEEGTRHRENLLKKCREKKDGNS